MPPQSLSDQSSGPYIPLEEALIDLIVELDKLLSREVLLGLSDESLWRQSLIANLDQARQIAIGLHDKLYSLRLERGF